MQRPQLRPGLRRVWRDATTLQLGLSPEHGTVLTGLQDGDDALIAALDGAHDLADLRAIARDRAVAAARVDELVATLVSTGVLVDAAAGPSRRPDRAHLTALGARTQERLVADADAWSLSYPGSPDGVRLLADRAARAVRVDGAGRFGATLATLLAAAGVGRVDAVDNTPVTAQDVGPGGHRQVDVGRSRRASVADAVRRVRDRPPAPAQAGRRPDLVVLVRVDAVDVRLADELTSQDQAHLAVVTGADRISVGPLVVPGHGPCLRCLDLHRRDRDPGWPHVVSQLVSGAGASRGAGSAETALTSVAAGLAALQVLVHLDGQVPAAARGRTLDVVLPDGTVERRRWRAHPGCGCVRLPSMGETGSRD
ncbi:ThiF family adenylyltransferase [Angustibacter luteus]|uniref:ThiF family adenylyltransferase n=1 Tax=Angustibacter luteus TaxID=658456 RepID=A0ABW1JGK0_9ACTN